MNSEDAVKLYMEGYRQISSNPPQVDSPEYAAMVERNGIAWATLMQGDGLRGNIAQIGRQFRDEFNL